MPDVFGQQPEAARTALQAANLLATMPAGALERRRQGPGRRHGPRANTEVAERTTVTCRSAARARLRQRARRSNGKTVADADPLLTSAGPPPRRSRPTQPTTDATQVGKVVSSSARPACG